MRNFFFLLFFFLGMSVFAQRGVLSKPGEGGMAQPADSVSKPDITEYKIITRYNDTTHVDTSLYIQKDYHFNYLRKDNFELLSFPNTAQTYNSLSYKVDAKQYLPRFGARARHFNFMEADDINYYRVPTPFTELYFKTVPEQGQQLDALVAVNTSDRVNISIAYKGVRALGKYVHMLTSTGNFRGTITYKTEDGKYDAKAHFVSQDLMNQENGGLDSLAIEQYRSKEEDFEDRTLLEMNYTNARSTLYGKRFFLDHSYQLTAPAPDRRGLTAGHVLNYNYKKFDFQQATAVNEIYGASFGGTNLRDVVRLDEFYNEGFIQYSGAGLGILKAKAAVASIDYGYNSLYFIEDERIDDRLSGMNYALGGEYQNTIGGFEINADAMLALGGDFAGNYITANAAYNFNEQNNIRFGIEQNSRLPDYNQLLYQSDYQNYNWQNDFDNVNTQSLYGKLNARRIASIDARLTQIQNYTYFSTNDEGFVKPFQHGGQVRYLKLKAERGFDFGVFGMYHTLMYQNVLDGQDVLNLPEFVTRNSIYYQDYLFQRALYLQTGFNFNYFASYNMNAYDPVLAEFYVQNQESLGNYPVLDFFVNAKVDQARIFFKLEHVNSLIMGNNNFVAPGYPYTDFLIRFGLVWNFFM